MAFFDVNRTVTSLPAYAALPETCRACTMLLRYSITLRFLRLLSQRKQVKFCVVPAWRERLSRDDWTALSAICLRGLSGHSSMLCSRLCSEANHAVLNSRIRGVAIVHLESQTRTLPESPRLAGRDQSLASIPSDKVQVFCMLGQRERNSIPSISATETLSHDPAAVFVFCSIGQTAISYFS